MGILSKLFSRREKTPLKKPTTQLLFIFNILKTMRKLILNNYMR